MNKLSMLGIIGGATLLAALPFSLQWSQVSVPLLTVSYAKAQTAGMERRHSNGTPSSTAHGSHGAAGDTGRCGATVSPARGRGGRQSRR